MGGGRGKRRKMTLTILSASEAQLFSPILAASKKWHGLEPQDMNRRALDEFLASSDTLRIYKGAELLFASRRGGLLALIEYIDGFAADYQGVVVLDKVMGNAAALLSIKAGCQEVFSPLGSRLAIATLKKYAIGYHLDHIVPHIQQAHGEGMCPMERLSIDKGPEEFHALLKGMLNKP
jgi:hypothetical protein